MNKELEKSAIKGKIIAPSSKSELQRLVVAALLADGVSEISYHTLNEDSEAILEIARNLCPVVETFDDHIRIKGGLNFTMKDLSVGESGLGLRMLAPILSTTGHTFRMTGRGSLINRPIGFVVETLRSAGVEVDCMTNSLPITLRGPISVNEVLLDGAIGSQLLTGFLMAAPLLNRDFTVHVQNLKSKPYIDLTISILKQFGISVLNHEYTKFEIFGGQNYIASKVKAQGDWSGIAFMLVAAAVNGEIMVQDIQINSSQGDKAILDVLKMCGAQVNCQDDSVFVSKKELNSFEFDATDVPDLFPPLVALAVNCEGTSVIKGLSRLQDKESNRGISLQSEFKKLGVQIRIDNDFMIIEGTSLHGGNVYSHNDHRIAMALAIAGLNCNEKILIEDAGAVAKSWPGFFNQLTQVGAKIS